MPLAQTVEGIVNKILDQIVDPFLALLFGIATLLFIWGVVQMLLNPEDTEARENGKRHIVWGIFGSVIMLGVGGIIRLLMTIWK